MGCVRTIGRGGSEKGHKTGIIRGLFQKNFQKGEMKNEKEKTFGMAHDIGYDDWAYAGNCSGGS